MPGEVRAPKPTDDPLGVRPDFPVVHELTYLDGAYTTPSPQQAVEFLGAKARNPVSLGGMLGETVSLRQTFARLVGASEAEVGFLLATSDGQNIVTRALEFSPGDNVVVDDLPCETTSCSIRSSLSRPAWKCARCAARVARRLSSPSPRS
jgi:selenocysteine lyase/cysteine desulfurase